MEIELDDLSRSAVQALLEEHLRNMHAITPAESVHALDLDRLRGPDIRFWTAWEGTVLLGCGALQEIAPRHGEIKSMRTPVALRRRGVGRAILVHIVATARSLGYGRLSLETGSADAFRPARRLYESFGFAYCEPFGKYVADPNSVFMTLALRTEATMQRVTGIGGIFFKARDPVALRAWYQKHLGIDVQPWGGAAFSWTDADGKPSAGTTIWSVGDAAGDYYAPSTAPFMVNYRVADVHALVAALRAEGCNVLEKIDESEYGKFAWVMDPEGHKVELWEPPPGQ